MLHHSCKSMRNQLVLPLSLARRLNANLNFERISKNSSSEGPLARMAKSPSPACPPLPFLLLFLNCNSRRAAAACWSRIMKRSMSSKQWFKMETYLSFVRDLNYTVSMVKNDAKKECTDKKCWIRFLLRNKCKMNRIQLKIGSKSLKPFLILLLVAEFHKYLNAPCLEFEFFLFSCHCG